MGPHFLSRANTNAAVIVAEIRKGAMRISKIYAGKIKKKIKPQTFTRNYQIISLKCQYL
jgi:hypothetical protein